MGIEPEDIVVIHASNFKGLKRVGDVVASGALAIQREPRLRYLLLGDGETLAETEAAIATLPQSVRSRSL